ncbi:hydroxyacylglutathione hydrolase [Marinomonas sp. 15G1-11]|uniref:Hydroxyacylglutathione hydrolase n=1 Tax=Marinomonas phaeophyticola TaxID=3004091 RepID=A0ABT4JX41_9GAMM|nr:hydroxyacylglutathione hydrolase [Marinomonas sp. 15G1-11]MCZ2722786.1 hydroxyacylglutathione hydrolase [Marinomonas sp. 15G1-11]
MTILPLPAFNDNYIWAILQKSKDLVWVVDPGDAEVVVHFLQQQQKSLAGILITHHHFDHTGGVKQLKAQFNCPVYGPHHLSPLVTHPVAEGDSVTIFERSFTVFETPAHTLDHLCYFSMSDEEPILFSGDTLFRGGCGRLMEGNAQQMLAAMNRFKLLPDQTLVYCTHEYTLSNYQFALSVDPDNLQLIKASEQCQVTRQQGNPTLPSSIALEKACNPFMRSNQKKLVTLAARQIQEPMAIEEDKQFSQVRRAKDAY